MKLKSNKLFLVALGGVFLSNLVGGKSPALAQYYSNGGNQPQIVVDKKISVDNKNYFNNITANQKVLTEGDQISFKIVVENRGNTTLTNIKMTDLLPKYLSLLIFPGELNKSENKIEATIASLEPGQSKEYLIVAKISDLPASISAESRLQMVNRVTAGNNVTSDTDQAKYFVALKSVPTTGSNDLLIQTGAVLSVTVLALGLRKVARGY